MANMKHQEADVATVQSAPLPLWEPHPRTGRADPQEPTIRRKQRFPLGVVTWSV